MSNHPGMHSTPTGKPILSVGIALFMPLPKMRLILMLGMFVHRNGCRFSAIAAIAAFAALVLTIVAAG